MKWNKIIAFLAITILGTSSTSFAQTGIRKTFLDVGGYGQVSEETDIDFHEKDYTDNLNRVGRSHFNQFITEYQTSDLFGTIPAVESADKDKNRGLYVGLVTSINPIISSGALIAFNPMDEDGKDKTKRHGYCVTSSSLLAASGVLYASGVFAPGAQLKSDLEIIQEKYETSWKKATTAKSTLELDTLSQEAAGSQMDFYEMETEGLSVGQNALNLKRDLHIASLTFSIGSIAAAVTEAGLSLGIGFPCLLNIPGAAYMGAENASVIAKTEYSLERYQKNEKDAWGLKYLLAQKTGNTDKQTSIKNKFKEKFGEEVESYVSTRKATAVEPKK